MSIRVTLHDTHTHSRVTFTEATSWHVDDAGRLHITKAGDGNVATFHPAAWIYAEKVGA